MRDGDECNSNTKDIKEDSDRNTAMTDKAPIHIYASCDWSSSGNSKEEQTEAFQLVTILDAWQ